MQKRVLEKMKEIKMWKFSIDRHALQSKARDDRKKADSRDCHDFASAKSRNDRETPKPNKGD